MKLQITLIKYGWIGEHPQHEEKFEYALDYDKLKNIKLSDLADCVAEQFKKGDRSIASAEIKIKFIEDLI